MLNRQKAILELLRQANRPVTHFQLTKWSFLLRHEFPSGGGNAFYDFVPYKYGPFSFALYQEVGKLVDQSYVIQPKENHWEFNQDLQDKKPTVDAKVGRDIEQLLRRFGNYGRIRLVDYVYGSHPRFTVNSEIKKLQKAKKAKPGIYTAGYEGLSIDAFLDMLCSNGIKRIIDVRNNPIARRYGFHKSTLSRLSGRLGIHYKHIPELGIHSRLRQDLIDQSDYEQLFELYEKQIIPNSSTSIQNAASLCKEMPSVLICMERDHCSCHRGRLAPYVSEQTSLPVIHLMPDAN